MRKLATIQVINNIEPIKDADMIEKATVLGWEVVIAKKDNFKIGNKIIYIEVDSVMPEKPEFEFLRKYNFRIKTQKLRGQISQGLILPLNTLSSKDSLHRFMIGDDVTEMMKITKYLSPSEREEIKKVEINQNKLTKFMKRYSWYRRLFLSRKQKEGFPYWCTKSDETRLQNIPQVLEQFKDKEVYITEKIDYQSVTFTGKLVPRFNNWFGIKMFNLINKL